MVFSHLLSLLLLEYYSIANYLYCYSYLLFFLLLFALFIDLICSLYSLLSSYIMDEEESESIVDHGSTLIHFAYLFVVVGFVALASSGVDFEVALN